MLETPRPTVSVVIRALNEERRIAEAIESALAALHGLAGEVILADSASSDRTVEIAAKYPIKIVKMNKIDDRSCAGAGQLGYQYSLGRYICVIDGDMRLRESFLTRAVRFLDENLEVAGVAGGLIEQEKENLEFIMEAEFEPVRRAPGRAPVLEGPGMYRREAITSVRYFGDRNLHAAEDLDLAARLKARGWKLVRLDLPFVDHYGHSGDAYRLLLRRWKTRYAFGNGEAIRASVGKSHFWPLLQMMKKSIFQLSLVHAWWFCLLALPFIAGGFEQAALGIVMLGMLPFALIALRYRSVRRGIYRVIFLNFNAAAIWPGLLRRGYTNQADWIDSTIIGAPAVANRRAAEPLLAKLSNKSAA
jgi:glycosyltransferase involved in cell wall biosynthesis